MNSNVSVDRRPSPLWIALGVLLAVVVGVLAPLLVDRGAPANAADAGVPVDPAVLYTEDFEQGAGITPLTGYTSASGQTYTADSYWLNQHRCNGFIVNWNVGGLPSEEYCNKNGGNWNGIRAQAGALGLIGDPATGDANRALSVFTTGAANTDAISAGDGPITGGGVAFETVNQIPMSASNRFVTFSVDASAANCNLNQPMWQFSLKDASGNRTPVPGGALNPCSDERTTTGRVHGIAVSYGSFPARGSFLFDGSSLGIVLQNETLHTYGNDGAIDNIRVLDVTPRLDVSYEPGRAHVADGSRFTMTVTNTSELAEKNGWSFTNALPAGLVLADDPAVDSTCTADVSATGGGDAITAANGVLAAGETSCTITVSVRSTEFTADEPATERTYTSGPAQVSNAVGIDLPQTADVTFYSETGLELVKSASITDADDFTVGAALTYSFEVTNTGDVNLSQVAVTEGDFTGSGALSAPTCPTTALAPGASTTCTATYTVTQADVDRGSIANTATAGAVDAAGTPVGADPSTVTSPITQSTGLSLVKTASPTAPAELVPGATVTYAFEVTNDGNTSASGIAIVEGEFTGSGALSAMSCPATELAPGASTTCTATYTVTQADVDAGSLSNTATATGGGPSGEPLTSDPSTVVSPIAQTSALEVVKTASPTTPAELVPGATLTYSFAVTNAGNTTVSGVAIAEGEFTGSGALAAPACVDATLAPGAATDCTATYTVTQEDVDRGSIANTATATGTDPSGGPVTSDPSTVTSPIAQAAGLSVVKSASLTEPAQFVVGATNTYTFAVTNTGNVTLSGIAIAEGDFTGSGALSAPTCPVDALAPGASTDCTATYTVTQADVDAGSVSNTASATATDPSGDPVPSDPSTVTSPILQERALSITKTASPTAPAELRVGTPVTYTFVVTNDGNTTVTGAAVVEGEFTGSGELSAPVCGDGTLAPGASMTCTAAYTVTQADVDAGTVSNTATATGTDPQGGTVGSDPSTATSPIAQAPGLTVVKTATPADPAVPVGSTVDYAFEVTNSGDVTVTDLAIAEGAFSGSGALPAPACPVAELAPGASTTCTAAYTVTQADVDAGALTNTATATGSDPAGAPVVSDPSTASVPMTGAAALELVKSVGAAEGATFEAGTELTYSFEVTNTGTMTLSGVVVDEGDFDGAGALSEVTCPETTLAPGASTVCTAAYEVTQADVDRGSLTNTATAGGTTASGDPVRSDPSTATIERQPGEPLPTTPPAAGGDGSLPTTGTDLGPALLIAAIGIAAVGGGVLVRRFARRGA